MRAVCAAASSRVRGRVLTRGRDPRAVHHGHHGRLLRLWLLVGGCARRVDLCHLAFFHGHRRRVHGPGVGQPLARVVAVGVARQARHDAHGGGVWAGRGVCVHRGHRPADVSARRRVVVAVHAHHVHPARYASLTTAPARARARVFGVRVVARIGTCTGARIDTRTYAVPRT